MSTQAQLTANQANAQHSTGPRTEQGRAIAAQNNFRHGFTGVFRVLQWESEKEFDALHTALREEHRPSTVTETVLVDKMAQALWLSKRAAWMQHEIFNAEEPGCDHPHQTTNDRAFHKCLNDLLKLRAETRKQEIGFVSHEQKRNQETHRQNRENRKQELHKWSLLLAEAKLDRQLLQNSTTAHAQPGAQPRFIAAENAA